MHNTRALIDGHLRASLTALFDENFDKCRILLANSAWNDSSFWNRDSFRIQDSAPWSSTGMTHDSTMLREESGFNDPRKTPCPLAKKAPLAFLIFFSIRLEQERLGVHHAPRHRAVSTRGMLTPSEIMEEEADCWDGETIASHLSKLRTRPLESANFLTCGASCRDVIRSVKRCPYPTPSGHAGVLYRLSSIQLT